MSIHIIENKNRRENNKARQINAYYNIHNIINFHIWLNSHILKSLKTKEANLSAILSLSFVTISINFPRQLLGSQNVCSFLDMREIKWLDFHRITGN